MEYSNYTYLFPPRPEKAIARDFIGFYEKRSWVAQVKMNGTCSVLAINPQKQIVAMSRHKTEHKLWTPTEENNLDFSKLPGKGWYVFIAELMHSKIPGIRNVNYVHDVLVDNGDYLVGETFWKRQERLEKLLLKRRRGKSRELLTHWEISPTLWLAKNHEGGFYELFEKLNRPEHEGLVFKNPNAPLAMCMKEDSNTNWQVKCRKLNKNFSF